MKKWMLPAMLGFAISGGLALAAKPDFSCKLPKACTDVTNISFSAPSSNSSLYVMTVSCKKIDGEYGMYTTNWTSGWAIFGAGRADIPDYVKLVRSENDDKLTCD